MTYFALPPRAAAMPCLALVTLVPTLALMTPAQMRWLAAGEPQHRCRSVSSNDASNLDSCDQAVGLQLQDRR
ncbi:hypothetical protein M0D46_10965 [Xanthomonas prunicola]|uniref:Uncharacterized protein n=1 Tax=Xanthomonas prunicola TaxID=2053930 RepID=A0A9Q9MRF1_9XANT|nr:hypothetical protein [Xanthomonas prunicola]UXA47462.1 hypothetical protein M0D44_13945 [Xanthomonas prunicola]UXA55922.1 hypothetical protein M0D47_13885 [Xanthomonas prunicola]UXA61899.1 hypothetical protein M0D48_02380 [Xanthomonas prunicola]UXA64094.1 hypothetical protein M0D43_14060 [Xanthomonas prunicola]UXA71453.1 hypothetical protein M0D46_10965 [Xanthomonas prunicola]